MKLTAEEIEVILARHSEQQDTERFSVWCERNPEARAQLLRRNCVSKPQIYNQVMHRHRHTTWERAKFWLHCLHCKNCSIVRNSVLNFRDAKELRNGSVMHFFSGEEELYTAREKEAYRKVADPTLIRDSECPSFQVILWLSYERHRLSPREQLRIEWHMDGCLDCAAKRDKTFRFRSYLAQLHLQRERKRAP